MHARARPSGLSAFDLPILDRAGTAIAALSVGTLASRLNEERLPMVVELLKRQADAIGPLANPFDVALRRRPTHALDDVVPPPADRVKRDTVSPEHRQLR